MSEPPTRWRAVLQLCRASNLPTVWGNVLAGWFLAGGEPSLRLIPLLLGATALYCGGTTLNDAADAHFDRQYRPERPIPSGVFTRAQVTALGIGWLLLGSVLTLLAGASALPLLAVIACIVVYDLIHKRTNWGTLFMGGARATLVLTAGSAGGGYTGLLLAWAAVHWIYITGLTWTASGESGPEQKSYPRAQTTLLMAPLLLGLAELPILAMPEMTALILTGLAFGLWVAPALPCRREPLPPFKGIPRLLAGIVLIDAVALSAVAPLLAIAVAASLLPLALYLQKSFAAT